MTFFNNKVIATIRQNGQNRHESKINKYVGVYKRTNERKVPAWEAMISCDGTRVHLGYFATPELARDAYVRAVEERGEVCL